MGVEFLVFVKNGEKQTLKFFWNLPCDVTYPPVHVDFAGVQFSLQPFSGHDRGGFVDWCILDFLFGLKPCC